MAALLEYCIQGVCSIGVIEQGSVYTLIIQTFRLSEHTYNPMIKGPLY